MSTQSAPGPLFSVVTVTLNNRDGLIETRNSLRAQTFRSYEWVVVDGGSADNTADWLRALPEGEAQWISEPDRGIYDGMNKGIARSSGEYLVFMNAGDSFSSRKVLESVAAELCSGTAKPDILFGGANVAFSNNDCIYRAPYVWERYIWHSVPAIHQATYFRRASIADFGYDPSLRLCGDYYIAAMCYQKRLKAKYLDEALVNFAVGGRSYGVPPSLFLEPLAIQRDVLGLPMYIRYRSLMKRLVSAFGLVVLRNGWGANWARRWAKSRLIRRAGHGC